MPNFAILFPAIVYLPVIILALAAIITGVTHCIFAWPDRTPAPLPDSRPRRRINTAILANNFAGLERA